MTFMVNLVSIETFLPNCNLLDRSTILCGSKVSREIFADFGTGYWIEINKSPRGLIDVFSVLSFRNKFEFEEGAKFFGEAYLGVPFEINGLLKCVNFARCNVDSYERV